MTALITFFLSPIGRLIGVGIVATLIAGFSTWWVTSSIDGAAYAKLQTKQAQDEAARAEKVLADFVKNSKTIADAAREYGENHDDLNKKLDVIANDLKNAQHAAPLPANCKPDPRRVRSFNAAIDAANDSIARQQSGAAVPATH